MRVLLEKSWSRSTAILLAVLGVGMSMGCDPEIEQREPLPEGFSRTIAMFDPDTRSLPLPNGAALDPVTGRLPNLLTSQQFADDAVPGAEKEFSKWFSSQHGWPAEMDIEIPFSGTLKASTVNTTTIRMFQFTAEGAVPVEIEAPIASAAASPFVAVNVRVVPSAPLLPGHNYAIVVTKDIEDSDGRNIGEPLAIYFAASKTPLIDANDQPVLSVLKPAKEDEPEVKAQKIARAKSLEGLRLGLAPVFAVAEDHGIERGNVAMAFGWKVVPNTFTVLDPLTATVPLPNTLGLDPRDGTFPRTALCSGPDDGTLESYFDNYIGSFHGWPTTTPITLPLSGAIDEATLTEDSVQLWRVDGATPERIAATLSLLETKVDRCSGDISPGYSILLIPAKELSVQARYVAFATRAIRSPAGHPLLPPPAVAMAIQPHPVFADGKSLVSRLDNDQAMAIAGLQQLLGPASAAITAATGIAHTDLSSVWVWHTPQQAFTVLDPLTATVPLPNTLGLDADGTFPRSALCSTPGAGNAMSYFEDYLGRLNGWPTSVPVTLPLSGPIDEATLTEDSVQLWRVDRAVPERITASLSLQSEKIDRCSGESTVAYSILVTPDEALDLQAHYLAFATRDIKSPQGFSLLPPVPILLGVQPDPVLVDGKSVLGSLTDAQATAIAGLQQRLRPAAVAIEAVAGVKHDNLSSVWGWFTWQDTFVVFDPTSSTIPFPNAFLTANGHVNLPTAGAEGLTLAILNELNTRVGFSVSSTGWIPLWGKLAPESISHESVAMASVPGIPPNLLGEDDYSIEYVEAFDKLLVTPLKPLTPLLRHAGIVTTELLGANMRPVQPTPAFVFLRSEFPLVTNAGVSNLPGVLDDATAASLDEARRAYALLFFAAGQIPGRNYAREDIANAWVFDTGTSTQTLQEYRARAQHVVDGWDDRNATVAVGSVLESDIAAAYPDPNAVGKTIDMSNIGHIQKGGEFTTANFLNLANAQMGGVSDVTTPGVGITVFVPKQDQGINRECAPPYDVVIVGHNLGGDRLSAGLATSNELAAFPSCLATVAMDFPLHGGRTLGSTDLHPTTKPATSGQNFLSANLLLTKSLFQQSVIDLSVLTRIIRGDGGVSGLEGLIDADESTTYFTDQIAYLGASMGGILGTLFITVEPDVSTAVLNAAGGKLTWLLEGSIGEGILAQLAAGGVVPGTFNYVQTMSLIQWVADHADPFTFAPHTINKPLDVLSYISATGGFEPVIGADCETSATCNANWSCRTFGAGNSAEKKCVRQTPANEVLLQMVTDDETVPNICTELLADTMGVSLDATTFDGASHGFFFGARHTDAADYVQGQCARLQAAAWLSSGLSGTASLPETLEAATCIAGL
ncbi:MAG: hypothetical protein H0U74_04755 [Bradymonadaceae bacterium]|nr:hypothetical protein [Lujinxingiaceae bacterium]